MDVARGRRNARSVSAEEMGNFFVHCFESYPERNLPRADAVEGAVVGVQAWLVASLNRWRVQGLFRIVAIAAAFKKRFACMDDANLLQEAGRIRKQLRITDCADIVEVARCFAMVREGAGRVLGLRHHNEQIVAGYALMRGMVAEMATGEGKTLVATLPAIVSGLAGCPVHVITANDYLTERNQPQRVPLPLRHRRGT